MEQTISIIVPVYNAAKTLARCVDSLTGQTYENLEILLVNDGSRDESLSLCREYAASDSRIRVIDKPNGGVSSARTAGLDAARGDFVLFCDSDDWVEPDLCESMLEQYRPGDTVICEADRKDIQSEHSCLTEEAERKNILNFTLLACALWNKLFIRSAIGTLRFHEELRLGEDFCFVMEYLSRVDGKLRFLYRRLYHYNVDTAGSLSKRAPDMEQCDAFCRYLTCAMEALGAVDAPSLQIRNRMVMHHFVWFLEDTAQNPEPTVAKKISSARIVGQYPSFRTCCKRYTADRNSIFVWLVRHHRTTLLMILLLIREKLSAK